MASPASIARKSIVPAALALAGAVACLLLLPGERHSIEAELTGFPDASALAHHARLWVLTGMCFLPAFAAMAYQLGGVLDRYITRQFLAMFAICLAALYSIWLLIDLSDNLSDFQGSGNALLTMARYHATRAPSVMLLLLPFALLLALLQSLGKLSTHREIIAMVQAGRGVPRIVLPLFVAAGFCALLAMGLNYHWAPVADGRVDDILSTSKGGDTAAARHVLYRDPASNRLWMIGAFPRDFEKGAPLRDVEVTLTNADHTVAAKLNAPSAAWDRAAQQWTFHDAVVGKYAPGQPVLYAKADAPLTRNWHETPWQLVKPGLAPAYLGIPGLDSWLHAAKHRSTGADPAPYLTHWHYRWALPLGCLVTVLVAAPLSIHFSRRGGGGGVFFAILLSALMMLVGHISLAFGESAHLPPAIAAWLPNIAFSLLGLYLFRRRISGKPIYRTLRNMLPVQ